MKTSELEGAALDWAVAKAEGWDDGMLAAIARQAASGRRIMSPSTDWSRGGPLIDKHIIEINSEESCWEHQYMGTDKEPWYATTGTHCGIGVTPLIAAMRAIVASELGDEIDVPAELREG